jgi:hypothetical protein
METAPLNAREPMVDASFRPSKTFIEWATSLLAGLGTAPSLVHHVAVTGKTAAIGTTSIPTGTLSAGVYRLSWQLRITSAAGVSSAIQITLGWTSHSVAHTYVGTTVNGNTTATHESAPPLLIAVDAGSPVTYAISYASNPASAAVYAADVILEAVA